MKRAHLVRLALLVVCAGVIVLALMLTAKVLRWVLTQV